jgi:pimeloyl-ACP methyl ester carboxylesterase
MTIRDKAGRLAHEPAARELRLPDGRILTYCLYGPEDGEPVLFQFGTPGTRFLAPDRIIAVNRVGVRLLVPDRPGYGGSTRLSGRSVAEVGVDMTALVGLAPFDAEGLDWYDGMSPGNVVEFARARSGERAYRPLVEKLAREAVAAVEKGHLPVADDYELAESDRAALSAQFSAPGHLFRTRTAYIGGINGWIDDGIAFTRNWEFDLKRISAPVSIWYGPDDALSPRAHTDWLLSHISGAEAHALPAGHLLDVSSMQRLYRWLVR